MKPWLSNQIDGQNRTFRRLMTAIAILVTGLLASSITLLVIAFVL
jgi:hypothetical protein